MDETHTELQRKLEQENLLHFVDGLPVVSLESLRYRTLEAQNDILRCLLRLLLQAHMDTHGFTLANGGFENDR